MGIFEHLDYRVYLKEEIAARKANLPGFTIRKFAERAEIRNTYLNNVIHGNSNLNGDQVYSLAKQLQLQPLETEYFFLLREFDQTTLPERKHAILAKLKELRQEADKTESHIGAKTPEWDPKTLMRYYSDPLNKIVHVMAQIPQYAKEPNLIPGALVVPASKVETAIGTLIELGLLSYKEKTLEVLKKNYHLPKDSPMLLPHQAMMRSRSTEKLLQLAPEKRYSFAVTLSTNPKVRDFIQAQFMLFLERIEPEVKASESQDAYQLNFDLFPWSE